MILHNIYVLKNFVCGRGGWCCGAANPGGSQGFWKGLGGDRGYALAGPTGGAEALNSSSGHGFCWYLGPFAIFISWATYFLRCQINFGFSKHKQKRGHPQTTIPATIFSPNFFHRGAPHFAKQHPPLGVHHKKKKSQENSGACAHSAGELPFIWWNYILNIECPLWSTPYKHLCAIAARWLRSCA